MEALCTSLLGKILVILESLSLTRYSFVSYKEHKPEIIIQCVLYNNGKYTVS